MNRIAPTGTVKLLCKDTLFHRSGRNVDGGGTFRDVARSTVELRYEHIPIAHGGAPTVGNLQILCGPRYRRKGACVV